MSVLQIRLFGKFEVKCNNRVQDGLCTGNALDLLCYVLLHRGSSHHREMLADLLCPASTPLQARKCLSQALWQLQAALTSRIPEVTAPLLAVGPEWISVNPDVDLWLDIGAFERAYEAARNVPGQVLEPGVAEDLREAVELYRGDLLEGTYRDWCLYERERLQNMHLTMLDKLATYCEARHDHEAGIGYVRRALSYDRAHESSHVRLMRLYYLAGDRVAALRQYERCVSALREDLDVAPSRRTIQLYEAIRSDQLGMAPHHPTEERAVELSGVSPGEAIGRFRQLQVVLADLLRVEKELQRVGEKLRECLSSAG